MEGVSGGALVASVIHPAGSIATLLVANGLAQINDFTLAASVENNARMRQLERTAKE